MKIIDSFFDMMELINKMDGEFDIDLWETYIEKIATGLSKKLKFDSNNYDFYNDIIPVINLAINDTGKLKEAHNSFTKSMEYLSDKIQNVVGFNLQVDIIFYIGLCNGAGWATELNGRKIVLLGVEKIIELDWCDCDDIKTLVYHELGHIWHDQTGTFQIANTIREKYMLQLFREGIATYFEQTLSGNLFYYRWNKEDWLKWCVNNKRKLFTEFLKRLQSNESAQDFFGDWNNYCGYSDVGYFIGCEFVKLLARKYSLSEIVNLELIQVFDEFCKITDSDWI